MDGETVFVCTGVFLSVGDVYDVAEKEAGGWSDRYFVMSIVELCCFLLIIPRAL